MFIQSLTHYFIDFTFFKTHSKFSPALYLFIIYFAILFVFNFTMMLSKFSGSLHLIAVYRLISATSIFSIECLCSLRCHYVSS